MEPRSEDLLAEGILSSLKPSIEELDGSLMSLRHSQITLQQSIESLSEEIKAFSTFNHHLDLDTYLKKLTSSRRRVMLVSNILHNSQERLLKIQNGVAREMAKKKTLLAK